MQDVYFLHSALAFWSVVVGAFLCAVYDVFRLFRLRRKQNGVLLFVCDFAFCLISAIVMLVLFFNLSYGRMRAYAFVFALIGFLIWRMTASRLVMSLMYKIITATCKVLNLIKMRVCVIVKHILRRIYTIRYCNKTVAKIEVKRKEQKNDRKETGSC
ncbi:MAG: spore cortex biosynthesis protein YabQ [Clostridia bacterium]|nr:spore cortex biosynthesis protein YabQ [Clostridia bacterium]